MTAPSLPRQYLTKFPVGYPFVGDTIAPPELTRNWPVAPGRPEAVDSPTDIMFFGGTGGTRGHLAHGAIDILGAFGLPVYATKSGTVPASWRIALEDGSTTRRDGSGTSPGGGNFVTIVDDDAGYYHYYAHMQQAHVFPAGTFVRAGTVLGYLGGSGSLASRSHQHLHYQVSIRNDFGGPVRHGNINSFGELVRLAQARGGRFENLNIPGYNDGTRWMVLRPENYRRL